MHTSNKIVLPFLLTTYLLCNTVNNVVAQLPLSFTNYNIINGLPDNNINAIAQDKYGFVWIGTDNGLVRFDGKNFVSFASSPAFASLPTEEVLALQNYDSNTLAVVTRRGLCMIDVSVMASSAFVVPPRPGEEAHEVNKQRNLLIGWDGSLFVTTTAGFYHFNNKKELIFRYDDYPIDNNTPKGFGIYTLWLNQDNILTAGQNGYYVYNIQSKKWDNADKLKNQFFITSVIEKFKRQCHFLQVGKGQLLALPYKTDSLIYIDENKKLLKASKIPIDSVMSLFTWRSNLLKINDSTLLLSGKFSGLYTINLNSQTGAIQLDTNARFKNKKCNVAFIDKHHKYWIGFSDGLKVQNNSPVNLQQHPMASLYERDAQRQEIHQTAATKRFVYAASQTSGGAYRFIKNTLEFDSLIPFPFPPFGNKSLHSSTYWSGDTVLFGSDAGLFLYDEKKEKALFVQLPGWNPRYNWVGKIFIDNKKNAWISTNKSDGCYLWKYGEPGAVWFDFNKTLPAWKTEIGGIKQSPDGNIWITGKGVVRYNTTLQKIDYKKERIAASSQQSSNYSGIAFDDSGFVWLSNWTIGLIKLNPWNDSIVIYDQHNGLFDKKVNALAYHNGFVWIVCNSGISKINTTTGQISSVISLKDVFYQSFFCDNLLLDAATQSFFTGSGKHVIRFEPEYPGYQKILPKLLLLYVKPGNDSIIWFPQKTLKVSWQKRNITLFVNAINYEDAEYQRYAYRLINGNTSEWINIDEQRRINLQNLKAGKTTIQLKVYSPQKAWPEQIISYEIEVIPPFWHTGWFITICFLLAASILYAVYNYKSRQKKKLEDIREGISKDLHDEVGATLSGIAMYSHMVKSSLDKSNVDMAMQSANIIQESSTEMVNKLNDIVWLIKPQNESMEALIERLKTYTNGICAAKNIEPDIQIAPEAAKSTPPLDKRKNIYLICKEAINNAAKYSGATVLSIHFAGKEKWLHIIIKDNGQGFNPDNNKNGNGLNNMQDRAQQIGAILNINTAPGKGCTVELQLKITQRGIV